MVLDTIGDLLADRRQLKQVFFDDRIVGLLGKVPIKDRLAPHTVRPIVHAEHSTVELGAVTIHSGAFTRTPHEADVGSQSADTIKLSFRSQLF
jgi:hypothetical protein